MHINGLKVVFLGRGNMGEIKEMRVENKHHFFKSKTKCVVPHLLGFPLFILDNYQESNQLNPNNNEYATKCMIQPETGFAPNKWLIGDIGDCLIGRHDGKDFEKEEFLILWDYIDHTLDLWGNDEPPSLDIYTVKSFINYHKDSCSFNSETLSDELKIKNKIKILKEKGIKYFEESNFIMAFINFNKANHLKDYLNHNSFSAEKELINSLILNIANCLNKLNLFDECLDFLGENKVENPKFYFHRGIALANLANVDGAYEDLDILKDEYKIPYDQLNTLIDAIYKGNSIHLRNFTKKNNFTSYDDIIKLNNLKRPSRNIEFTKTIYEKCKEIYYLLGTEKESHIKNIFEEIYAVYGMEIMRNCYYIIYDSNQFMEEDLELYSLAKLRLEKYLDGIGGWQN